MVAVNFQKRFAPDIESGRKRTTVRATWKDGKVPWVPGEELHLYTGLRTKSAHKLAIVRCVSVRRVVLSRTEDGRAAVFLGDSNATDGRSGRNADPTEIDGLAREDGFASPDEMLAWFDRVHGLPFDGWLIEWRPVHG